MWGLPIQSQVQDFYFKKIPRLDIFSKIKCHILLCPKLPNGMLVIVCLDVIISGTESCDLR